ncbi:GTPase IMAP family member 4-like isoform X2 [Scomber scombrus]|uniref:GTPase IMAP family member 4-like isoform X2 n=1 Tax=Scomber scombrus TaxID=13677 RepID=UPI002DD95146|nr:GTPase IMAP family member 4-like isoform X2 [Scomber scombrus]
MAASYAPEPGMSSVSVLLLGEKQSGKSSAGNTILGRVAFHKKTTRSSKEDGSIFGIQVTVVDTPGWLSHSITPDKVSKELRRGVNLCHPEPHAILLVLPITTTFGQEELKAMLAQLSLLNTPVWQKAMVLFTHGDKLGRLPIREHIRQQGSTLQWLLERCGNRYQVMAGQSRASEFQVTELFEKILKMMEAKRHPLEVQQRKYTQLRRDVSMKQESRWQGRPVEIEMSVMYEEIDGMPRRTNKVESGRPYMPYIGFPAGQAFFKPALSLILLGRRKSGKSSVGKMILDSGEFKKTNRCSVGQREVLGWSVTVVDTPGWSQFCLADPGQVRTAISQSPSLCPKGNKVAFVLAVPVDSFREKDRRAIEEYLSILGQEVWRRTVVLFTYGEQLKKRTLEWYIEKMGEPLQWVLGRCGYRHFILDTNTAEDTHVAQLLEMVERL